LLHYRPASPAASPDSSLQPRPPIKRLDVAVLGDMRFRVAKDTLDDLFVRAQLMQVRSNATPEAMPAVPFQSDRFDYRTNDTLR